MSFPEVLQRITAALDRAGVAHMLTGSLASAYYGSLRSTQDIDFVIAATPPQVQAFIQGLPADEYYADADAAHDAFKRESMFNVIDLRTGWKIDMIIRKSRSFSQEEFGPPPAIKPARNVSLRRQRRGCGTRQARVVEACSIPPADRRRGRNFENTAALVKSLLSGAMDSGARLGKRMEGCPESSQSA
jgi:hypothetical protein